MTDPVEHLKLTLHASGSSLTASRRAVFGALQGKEPQTIAELIRQCKSADRASVYRTIQLFEELGIARRLRIGWKYKLELTDAFTSHHHHMSCVLCGRVIPLPENISLERTLALLATQQRFTMTDHQIELVGLCQTCTTQKA